MLKPQMHIYNQEQSILNQIQQNRNVQSIRDVVNTFHKRSNGRELDRMKYKEYMISLQAGSSLCAASGTYCIRNTLLQAMPIRK